MKTFKPLLICLGVATTLPALAAGDPKGEWAPVADAVGGQVVALGGIDRADEILPVVRKQAARPGLIEPGYLMRSAEKYASQDESPHTLSVGLRIGQRERRSPRSTKNQPAVDTQVLANPLQIRD